MISCFSRKIIDFVYKSKIIDAKDKDLYEYGVFLILSYLLFFIISLALGVFLDITIHSVIFYISFCLIRNYAGGIHAKTEVECDIYTTLAIIASELLIKLLVSYNFINFAIMSMIIFSLPLIFFLPVISLQKEVNKNELLFFRKKLLFLIFALQAIGFSSIVFNRKYLIIPISVSIMLSSILFLVGKIKGK